MLLAYDIKDYYNEYNPHWACEMPECCPPSDVMVPDNHPFYRLAKLADAYDASDFISYAEMSPHRSWGELLPLAVGLSIIEGEQKARRTLKLPFFRKYKGIISIVLHPADGVVKQTGLHHSHYTWWRTTAFQMSNLKMLAL